ncbi:MAG: serine/threonine protein kinase [Ktedonobacteraceae bacterium]|nr:serine/threonine protein kinase [Ktedonobacteraceae bacterium]
MSDRIGQQLGNYRLIRLLGKGGFAEVYLGEHLYIKRQAAVKLLRTTLGQKQRDNFLTEAQRLVDVAHPHIIRVLDFAVEDEIPFLVMEYAPNGSLRNKHSRGSRLALETILSYVKQAADALQYIHDQKLVHRDIKPENMLLDGQQKLLLSDFGIAAIAHETGSVDLQGHSGTPPYMAPEQIQGKPRPASDQYALGTVVYEWLSGSLPFQGSVSEILGQNLFAPPPSLRETIPTLPLTVEDVIFKALAKDPRQRFDTILDFAHSLEQAYQESCLDGITEVPAQEVHSTLATLSTPEHMPTPVQSTVQLNANKEPALAGASHPPTSTNLMAGKLIATDPSLPFSVDTPSHDEAQSPQLAVLPDLLTQPAETSPDQQRHKRSLPRRAVLIGAIGLLAGGGVLAYIMQEAGNAGVQGALTGQSLGSKSQAQQTSVPQSTQNAPSRSNSNGPSRSTSPGSSSRTTAQGGRSTTGTQPTSTSGSPVQPAPGAQPSPPASGNPNPTPTPTQVASPLTVQITDIPLQVRNNTDVPVTVTASAAGVEVQLNITYNLLHDVFNSSSQATDSNGQAVINWHVGPLRILPGLVAHVTAIAKDQNGQQATSSPVTVAVLPALL